MTAPFYGCADRNKSQSPSTCSRLTCAFTTARCPTSAYAIHSHVCTELISSPSASATCAELMISAQSSLCTEVVSCSDWSQHWHLALGHRFRAVEIWAVLGLYGLTGLRAYIRNVREFNFKASSHAKSVYQYLVVRV